MVWNSLESLTVAGWLLYDMLASLGWGGVGTGTGQSLSSLLRDLGLLVDDHLGH